MVKICVEKVRFRYPHSECDALRGLSLELPKGKATALLGPNASGKTTLFKVLLRILTPQEGTVYVDGEDITEFGRDDLSKLIAWVPQEEATSFPYTVLEYVLLGRAPHLGFFSLPIKKDENKIIEILSELGILHLSLREISRLSGGERRLVSIARTLAQEPEVLLLDEPTAHLDLGNKARVFSVIRRIVDSGKAVFFSTHNPNEASLIADNVMIINGGDIVSCGAPGRVITEDVLKTVYRTGVRVIKINGKPMVELASDNLSKTNRYT